VVPGHFHIASSWGSGTRRERGYISDTPENRVQDIHDMFLDPEVRAIVAAIGGDHSCHLLPHLDFDLIRDHPKIFMGYSDITVLNIAIWQATSMTTFNGPAFLTDFAEYPGMFKYTERHMLRVLCKTQPPGRIEPSPQWTEEFLDWEQKKDLERPRDMQVSDGWTWLKPGRADGVLIGGCLESLEHLRGTRFWPSWSGALMFFETSEEAPPPERVDSILMDYENMGVFEIISGLMVGRPMRYTKEQRQDLHRVLLERTRNCKFPLLADMDFGHTAPQLTLPIGCKARIDSGAKCFEILEPAVS
jgi:muramoyltetrapeptide carboxypeptidase LdcA involved in peptidoglycan recycling